MIITKREKVKSTPFSEFVRHAPAGEKIKFFDKVVQVTIKEQQLMIAKSNNIKETCKS